MIVQFPGSVRPYPTDEVTRVSGREEPAVAGGLDRSDVTAVWTAIERWYASGQCPAIALCLRRRGRIVLDRSIGIARGIDSDDPVVATPDTLFQLFSSSKMIVAVLVHQACERGQLNLDDRVADHVPEFAQNGKGDITLRDVLSHRSGLPRLNEPTTLELVNDRERIVRWLCEATPRLRPGRLAYHALTGGYILAEVVERATGVGIQELVQRDIATPLGLDHFRYGAEREDLHRIAENRFTGLRMPPGLSHLVIRSLGISAEDAARLSNDPLFTDAIIPSGNLVTTAEEGCRFMEALRRGGTWGDAHLLGARALTAARAEHSHFELDYTLLFPVRYGLGFMLGAPVMSPYGLDTKGVFGHIGFTQVVLWADPRRELAAALLTSGKCFLSPGLLHFAHVMQTIARRCK